MTARRIYKTANTWEQALNELEELAGLQFDPDIVGNVPYIIRSTALDVYSFYKMF